MAEQEIDLSAPLPPAMPVAAATAAPRQPHVLTDSEARQLKEQGFSTGMLEALTQNSAAFPLRIWVVDNSGSMSKDDGHRIVESSHKDEVKTVRCTRWTELQGTVDYHSQLAALLQAPTQFRLLNGGMEFTVAESSDPSSDVLVAHEAIRGTSPHGVTPLARHIREIRQTVQAMQPHLIQTRGRVAVVLATDGLPTDENGIGGEYSKRELAQELRSLEGLPVWLVVRLCTDDDDVVEYYNDLDNQLEMSLEVLDDFKQEAEEIHEHNKWLNYALPLHRCREMGFHHRLFDLLDERPFTKDELREFFVFLFGAGQMDGVPDAGGDWKGFVKAVDELLKKEQQQWDPVKKKRKPWVDLKKLQKQYGRARWW